MFCTQCGSEVEQHARFCSKCGQQIAAAAASPPAAVPAVKRTEHDMNMHFNILGWLLIGSGILTAIGGTIVLFASQIFRHMPLQMAREMPTGVPPFVAWLTSVVGLAIIAVAAATAAAGVGLLQYRSWARTFATIVAVLLLFHFPIGTAVAVYAFWVLFSQEGQQYYRSRSENTSEVQAR
jgi:zinc-ribbon domain